MMKVEKELKKEGKRLVWIILAVALINAFIVLFVLGIGEKELAGDELQYNQLATNLINNSAFSFETKPPFEPTLYRTPGYPIVLAFLYLIGGKSILFAKLFQFFLFGVNAYLLYYLAGLYTDEITARIASILSLIYFPFIFISGFLLTETVTIFLIISLLLLIKKYDWQNNKEILLDLIIGLLIGIVAMIRPTMSLVIIPLVLSLWLPFFFKKSSLTFQKVFSKSFILGCGMILIFTPWIIRNYSITNRFVPFTITTSNESLYVSILQYNGKISYAFTEQEWKNIYLTDLSRRRNDAEERIKRDEFPTDFANLPKSLQREFLVEESYKNSFKDKLKELEFFQALKKMPIRLAYLWSTADFAPNEFLHHIGQIQYLVFFIFAIIGILFSWKKILNHWLLLLFPIYLTLLYLIFHEEPRYTIPARPFLLLYSAVGISSLWKIVFIK